MRTERAMNFGLISRLIFTAAATPNNHQLMIAPEHNHYDLTSKMGIGLSMRTHTHSQTYKLLNAVVKC